MSWLLSKWESVLPFLALVGAAVLAALGALRRAERAGEVAERLRHKEDAERVRRKWDEVDRRSPDYDAAVDSLRARSNRDRVSGSE